MVGVRVRADEVVNGRHAVLFEVGCDLVGLCALGRVDEHDLPVALQQRTVALADVEIRHGQPVAGQGRRGDAGHGRGAGVGGMVAAVAEPGGKARDDEREHEGDQMIFGLRIAAASGLGHGSHLLFDDKRAEAPFDIAARAGLAPLVFSLRERPECAMPSPQGEGLKMCKNVCVSEYADIFSYCGRKCNPAAVR